MSVATMTLYHAAASPFVRKVMLVLHETAQLERVHLQSILVAPTKPNLALNADNPAGKLPALRLADGNVLHDSRVICEYLDHLHDGEPLLARQGAARWRSLTLASLADAILDAAVLIRYETFLRPADRQWETWLAAQQDKIERSLTYFEQHALSELRQRFDMAAIGLACALGYLDFRQPEHGWRERHPGLADWYAQVSQRPSMLATPPTN